MQGGSDKDGYNHVCLSRGTEQKSFRTHRLVAIAFIPNPENKPQVNHLDEVKTNNHFSNLEWATSTENNTYGSRIAKATAKTKNGKLSHKVLQCSIDGEVIKEWASLNEAGRYGFHKGNISNCIKGRSKTHKGFIWKLKEEKTMLKLYTQTVCSKCILVKFTLENAGVFDKVEIINLDEHEETRAWLKSNPASAPLTGLPILQYGEDLFTNQQQEIIDTVVNA